MNREKIIQLYQSTSPTDWELGLQLEVSQGVNLKDWWAALLKFYKNSKKRDVDTNKLNLDDPTTRIWLIEYLQATELRIPFNPPPIIEAFSKLEFLQIRSSKLKLRGLSQEISKLQNLKNLNLESNELESIPALVLELSGLRKLDLSRNPLRELSGDFSKLEKLQVLKLNNCLELKKISKSFSKLAQLQHVHLNDIYSPHNISKTRTYFLSYRFIGLLSNLPNLKKVYVGFLAKEATTRLREALPDISFKIVYRMDNTNPISWFDSTYDKDLEYELC